MASAGISGDGFGDIAGWNRNFVPCTATHTAHGGIAAQAIALYSTRHGKGSHKVQLTTHGAGPLVRAEAASLDDVSAFDLAVEKFELQIRKAHERRKDFGHKTIRTSEVSTALVESTDVSQILSETAYKLVREKEHKAEILEISSAIDQMELLDHDFYLFIEKESATPAVVYRRKGYAYGLIRLQGN
jgi:ribosome-associated translation inhibitor RaiA